MSNIDYNKMVKPWVERPPKIVTVSVVRNSNGAVEQEITMSWLREKKGAGNNHMLSTILLRARSNYSIYDFRIEVEGLSCVDLQEFTEEYGYLSDCYSIQFITIQNHLK